MRVILVTALGLGGCGAPPAAQAPLSPAPPGQLRRVEDFAGILDRPARSRALFVEAGRVLTHARCVNCHPSGDVPHQGMELSLHEPPVQRGAENQGVPGNECTTCHQPANQQLARVPGAPNWQLAPREMAWVGQSLQAICTQLKDPQRNGGRTLAQLLEHSAHDELVAWGWQPGADREPAPGTQRAFGELVAAWVDTGAECPTEGAP